MLFDCFALCCVLSNVHDCPTYILEKRHVKEVKERSSQYMARVPEDIDPWE